MRCSIGKDVEKRPIREAFAGLGLLPDEILWRPKEGFSDGLSSEVRPWGEILRDHIETLVRIGASIFSKCILGKNMHEKQQGPTSATALLWNIISFLCSR
jgi:hypothetical protein